MHWDEGNEHFQGCAGTLLSFWMSFLIFPFFSYLSGSMRKTCMSLMINQAITKMFASLPGANQVARFISSTWIFSRLLALYSESLSRTHRVATGNFIWSCERSFRSDTVGRAAPSSS